MCNRFPLIYKEKESEIKEILAECPAREDIEKILSEIELDIKDFYKTYSKEKISDAIHFAKDLKDRYTVLWMYYDMFGLEEI